MGRLIPQQQIDDVLERISVVDVVGQRVQLKKAGRDWKGLCPFHNEKTPSFTVSEEKGFYHCFGCGAHGTALTFLIEQEKLPFPEAIAMLAERAGVKLEAEALEQAGRRAREEEPLYGLLERTAEYFRRLLLDDPEAQRARDYAEARGLSGEVGERFGIGWAPAGWDRLCQKLHDAGVAPREALDAGLVVRREEHGPLSWEGLRDKFVDRLVFPIADARGRVVGFGARALRDDQQPKYLNSPTTAVFHKGRLLYNFHRARREIGQQGGGIVVEGYMDLIALDRAGLANVVATLGTALTAEHAQSLKRYAKRVTLLFDADAAGKQAAFKSLEVLLPAGFEPYGVFLEGGKDPDELLEREGPEALKAQIEKGGSLLDAFVGELLAEAAGADVAGKQALLARAAPVLGRIESPALRDQALRQLSLGLQLSEETVRAELRRAWRRPPPRTARADAAGPSARTQPSLPQAERTLLALYLQESWVRDELAEEEVSDLFTNEVLSTVYQVARELGEGSFSETRLLSQLADAEQGAAASQLASRLMIEPLGLSEEGDLSKALGDTLRTLRRRRLEGERSQLRQRLADPASAGDASLRTRLLDLERQLRQ